MHRFNLIPTKAQQNLINFNVSMSGARNAIAARRVLQAKVGVGGGYFLLREAMRDVRRALSLANAMRDRQRQALCLKILNWLRADMRRAAV